MKPMRVTEDTWITIEDGGEREYQSGGATDEGFDVTMHHYQREGDTITLDVYREARDCDGVQSWHTHLEWSVDGDLTEHGYPNFVVVDESQRDYEAEKAGY